MTIPREKNLENTSKKEWETPELVEINSGLTDVEFGTGPGTDGATGGVTTSLS